MFPDLLSIGPVTIHTYGLFVAMGFVAGLLLTLKIARQRGVDVHLLIGLGVYLILAAVVGSRLMYVAVHLGDFSDKLLDVLKVWQGGLTFQGGILAVMATLLWYVKKHGLSFWEMGDVWAPGAALGQAVGWIGCFLDGCGYGRPTDSPVGIVFTNPHSAAPLKIPLYPTQLFAATGGFCVTAILLMILMKRKFPGQVVLWYLIFHSTVSLFVEKYRGDIRPLFQGGSMGAVQGLALMILAGSVVTLFLMKSKGKARERD